MRPHVVDWADRPEVESRPGVSKREIDGVAATLVMVRVAAGLSADRHSHAEEQFVHVVSGTGRIETEQGARPFGPGTVFHFPAGTWHAAQFDTDTVLLETNLKPGA